MSQNPWTIESDVIYRYLLKHIWLISFFYRSQLLRHKNGTNSHHFIEPFLRDSASTRKYSRTTIASLEHPESEDINLELISTLIRFIHEKHDEGAVLVFLPGLKITVFGLLFPSTIVHLLT